MPKRVLLVNPHYPISETPSPPLGLAYLAGALEAAGVAVRLADAVVAPLDEKFLQAILADFEPDWVGVTAVTMNAPRAFEILRGVKSFAPNVFTVMGGPHASFAAIETLNTLPELDAVVRGEGERTLTELVLAPTDLRCWAEIPGLAFRLGDAPHFTPERPPLADLGSLAPPARHLIPLGRYRTLGMPVSITTSRGCPYRCIFCVGRKMVGAKVRFRPPASVVAEMVHLAGLGFRQINLADDLFTANRAHCLAICDALGRQGIEIRWSSFARVDTVSEDLLRRMRQAGCHAVSFGLESGSPDILRRIKKGFTLAQAEKAVEMCRAAGMQAHASFILGLPGETEETLAATLAFAERLGRRGLFYGFHLLAPFPGTEVRDQAAAYGLKILSHDWSDYHANRAICLPHGLKPARLDAIAEGWQGRFLDYLADIQRRMQSGDASPEEAAQIHNMNRTAILYEMMMGDMLAGVGTPREEGLAALARVVAPRLPRFDLPAIQAALQQAWDVGGLRRQNGSGPARWFWQETLP
jgi:anaerobic magnesium-protoporphyrin IX monomethyl ester cyclase